jgi:CheY-like chemotaxis protein
MPVMDGFEATRKIRHIENEQRSSGVSVKPAVIVALTGLASTQNEDEAFSAGVTFFVTKPVQFAQLKGLLEQVERRGE